MSEENVELVRRMFTEFDKTHRLSDSVARDFVWEGRVFRGWVGEDEFHGVSEFYEFLHDWLDAYDEWSQEIEDVLDAGEARVVALLRQRGRLRNTPDWVELHYGIVCTIEDGLIRRMQPYATPEEALEAAGLRE